MLEFLENTRCSCFATVESCKILTLHRTELSTSPVSTDSDRTELCTTLKWFESIVDFRQESCPVCEQ